MSGYSVRYNDDLTETLSAMLARTKSMYAVNHGLAPLFKSLLYENFTRSVFHVYCDNESLNEVT